MLSFTLKQLFTFPVFVPANKFPFTPWTSSGYLMVSLFTLVNVFPESMNTRKDKIFVFFTLSHKCLTKNVVLNDLCLFRNHTVYQNFYIKILNHRRQLFTSILPTVLRVPFPPHSETMQPRLQFIGSLLVFKHAWDCLTSHSTHAFPADLRFSVATPYSSAVFPTFSFFKDFPNSSLVIFW